MELAGEIMTYFPEKKVTIVDMLPRVCHHFEDKTVDYITKWLVSRGAVLELGVPIGGPYPNLFITEHGCTMKDGRELKADIVYPCTGFRPCSGIFKEAFPDCIDRRGSVLVNDFLQMKDHNNIFVMGDVMFHEPSNELKLGHTAEVNAHLVVDNLHALCGNRQMKTYPEGVVGKGNVTPKIYAISLGPYDATIGFNSLVVNGKICAVLKWLLEWTKVQAAAERPIGIYFWKLSDFMSIFLSNWVIKPVKKEK